MNINNGGNFHLQIDPVDGPSYVFMDTLDLRAPVVVAPATSSPGTITFDLPGAVAGEVPVGTYPQVFVDQAFLDGTLVAHLAPGTLFDTTVYQNVIDRMARPDGRKADRQVRPVHHRRHSGQLAAARLRLRLRRPCQCRLALTRVPFNEVPGLNHNGEQVGEGLECLFDVTLTGGFADLLSDLFLITDPVNYNIALNQLAGASYANYLQSFSSLGVHYNDILDHATSCEVPALAGSVLECRASSPIHVWGQLDYQTRKADGDSEAGTMKAKRFTGLLGVDASVGNAAILGVSAGMVTNHTRDHLFGDKVDADGMQVGAYAVYDPGAFYLKGVGTYSWYDGDSRRHIDFAGLGTGTSFAATVDGDPDVKMYTVGLHGGARFPMGGASVLTPYLNLDYVHAKMDEFIETGGTGAELHLGNNKSSHTFLTGGVKWATQMGGVVPEVNVGYRYRFGERRTDIARSVHVPDRHLRVRRGVGQPEARFLPRRPVGRRQDGPGRRQGRVRGRVQRRHQEPQRELQVRAAARWSRGAAASATAAASAAATPAAAGHANLPRRLGDPGDRHLPGTAATASAAAPGARTRDVRLAPRSFGLRGCRPKESNRLPAHLEGKMRNREKREAIPSSFLFVPIEFSGG